MRLVLYIAILLFPLEYLAAQTVDIKLTGKILSANTGMGIPGVSIQLKNSGTKTLSGVNGNFRINLRKKIDTLLCSHLNYQNTEIVVKEQLISPIIVQLEETSNILSEVTVSTGYQDIPKERVTGSFEKIDNRLFNQQTTTTVLSRLESIANGVFFDRKTGGSGNTNILVRGLSTIQGPKAPLIILDNFPYEGDLNNINPNDVETITLLKDAAAASIWGTRAGNGVIVITTKKGQFNQPIKTVFSSSISLTDKPNLFYLNTISASDFIDVEQFLYSKGFYNSQLSSSTRPPLSSVVELLAAKANGSLSTAEADARINALRNLDVRNDFSKYLYRKGVNQQYALSMQGGTQNLAWMLSAGLDKNLGQQSDRYERLSLRSNNTFKLTRQIQFTANLTYTQTRNQSGGPGYFDISTTNGRIPPYTQLADANGNALPVIRTYRQPYLDTAGGGKLLDWNYYPLTDFTHVNSLGISQDLLANFGISYKYNQNLSADIKYQYEAQTSTGKALNDPQSYLARDAVNTFSQLNRATGVVTYKVPKGSVIDNSNGLIGSNSLRGQINYHIQKGEHELSVIAGAEVRQTKSTATSFRNYGYNDDILSFGNVDYSTAYPNFITGFNSFINTGNGYSEKLNRFVSFFNNAAYTFKGKYTISASSRRDASNLFGVNTNNKWSPLWSAGVGWNISKETFYHSKFVPYLKLRATYGYSGNVDLGRSALTTLAFGLNSPYTQAPAARIDQYANPGLRWEKVGTLNIGLDFGTKNKRISGSVEYFSKKATDLLGNAAVDYTGVSTNFLTRNVASIRASGLDITINSINTTGVVGWITNLNLNLYRDKVVDYFLPTKQGSNFVNGGTSISAVQGNPVYAVYAYRWAGLDPNTGDPQGYYQGQVSKDYTSLLGSNTLISDLVYRGPAFPTLYGSLGNTLTYKNLSLTFRLTYKFGNYFQQSSINYNNLFSGRQGTADISNRWQKPGDELITNVPSLIYPSSSNRDNFYTGSEILVAKGDYIRLQYISLSYNLSRQEIRGLPFTSLEFFSNFNNVGIIWRANPYKIDPDYSNSSLPASRNISFGVKANF